MGETDNTIDQYFRDRFKLLTWDELMSACALNSVTDMYKYCLCCAEVERREKLGLVK